MKSNKCFKHLLRCYRGSNFAQTPFPVRFLSTSDASTVADEIQETFPFGELTNQPTIDRDTFLFGERVSFTSCGLGPILISALEASGKSHPTIIQTKVIAVIDTGEDVIVGAETGSGKTLSYLIPIIHGILRSCENMNPQDAEQTRSYPTAIIVVPNKQLCKQVHNMANEILHLLPREYDISIGLFTQIMEKWPYAHSRTSPHIAVCTPAFLANFIKGPNIIEENLFKNLRQVVFDEADMLFDGAYQTEIEKILTAFKLVRRVMIQQGEIQSHVRVLQHIIVAATLPSYGLKSVERSIGATFPSAIRVTNDYLHKHHPRIEQRFLKVEGPLLSPARIQLLIKIVRGITTETAVETKTETECNNDNTNSIELMKLQQTMIFVNTANDANLLAKLLKKNGLDNAEYHKNVTDPVRQESLRLFRSEEISVLVCTDSAARGLDLPNVRHVIQSEFATNVVQYLHRIGRTSRAGVLGRATNIYDDRSVALVESILLKNDDEKSVDQSFSRRRGFSKKIKKNNRALINGLTNDIEVVEQLDNDVVIEVVVEDSINNESKPSFKV